MLKWENKELVELDHVDGRDRYVILNPQDDTVDKVTLWKRWVIHVKR